MSLFAEFLKRFSAVRQIPIFADLNWLDTRSVAGRAEILRLSKGETVYQQGDPADGFYAIISGRVQGFHLDPKGGKQDVEFFRQGMYFGVISLLTGHAHSMTFEVLNDSEVLFIPKRGFQVLLKQFPQLGVEFSRTLSQRIHRRSYEDGRRTGEAIVSVYQVEPAAEGGSYAFHLSWHLARETSRRVVLVRLVSALDEAEHSERQDRIIPSWRFPQVYLNKMINSREAVRDAIKPLAEGLDILNIAFHPDDQSVVTRLSDFVTSLAADYDYVLMDLPVRLDAVVLKTLIQSDTVHFICRDQDQNMHMTANVIALLEDAWRERFDPRQVKVICQTEAAFPILGAQRIRKKTGYNVYARLPEIPDAVRGECAENNDVQACIGEPDMPYRREVVKIARDVGRVRIGLVLGGGAALGLAHIGVLKVLEEENIPVDIIAGSSMGALVGCLWVSGYSAGDLEELVSEFQGQGSVLKLLDPVFPVSGFIGGQRVKRWLRRYLGDRHFFDTRIPVKVVAYDLFSRQELVYETGLLLEAVRKSISIPGVFEPVVEGRKVIIDGGVLNPVPTNVLKGEGVTRMVAVNVLQSPGEVIRGAEERISAARQQSLVPFSRSPVRFLKARIGRGAKRFLKPTISDIMVQTLLASEYEVAYRTSGDADVIIHPDLSGMQWHEIARAGEIIRAGEQAARDALPEMKALIQKR
ncbi:MAG: patatin-like phospholipase family protein [Candidatus Omnitrophota bacterium]